MKKRNRFFGKTSQKLCVAGFVACALIAPVFQLEAVQDFILSDVATALIGRSLIELGRWRNFVKAFSALLVVAAFLVFGFLYSVATSARLSGYFKGAARELRDFFHNNKGVFNRRSGRILLAIFATAFLGFFALMRSGAGYRDDVYRQISGVFGWMPGFGRVVTEALNLAIHGAYLIHDRSPLGQIMATGFLSLAALVMALVFGGLSGEREGNRLKWHNIAAAMILVFNPYFLDGIAYKYDSPGMAASILFPLVPFLFIGAPRLYAISSFFCALGMYMSYQTSSGIYIMMVIFAALLKYLEEEWALGEAAKFCAKSAALFVAASAVFYLITSFLNASGQYREIGVSIGSAPRNITRYFSDITRDFNGLWKALSLLVAAAAAIAVCRLSKKRLFATLPLFAAALALATVLSQGSYIFLKDYYGAARGKYSFGALLAALASMSVLAVPSLGASWKKALAAAPAVLLAWSFFGYAFAFGNANASQARLTNQYMDLVRRDINELFAYDEAAELSITFKGTPPWSGEVVNLVKKYPITRSLVGYHHLIYSFVPFDMSVMSASVTVGGGQEMPFLLPVGETALLLERRYYRLLLEEGTGRIVVECKMGIQDLGLRCWCRARSKRVGECCLRRIMLCPLGHAKN